MSKSKLNYGVYNGKVLKKFLENSRVYFFAILLAVGIFAGAFLARSDSEFYSEIAEISENFLNIKNGQGIAENFIDAFAVNALYNALSLFMAFSLIGYPFIVWMPFLRGMGIGLLSGYLYSVYEFTGLGYCVLAIYPSAIISALVFVISCNDCCDYSKNAFAKAIRGRGQFEKDETKVFITRQIIFCGICAVSALADALLNALFSGFFES